MRSAEAARLVLVHERFARIRPARRCLSSKTSTASQDRRPGSTKITGEDRNPRIAGRCLLDSSVVSTSELELIHIDPHRGIALIQVATSCGRTLLQSQASVQSDVFEYI